MNQHRRTLDKVALRPGALGDVSQTRPEAGQWEPNILCSRDRDNGHTDGSFSRLFHRSVDSPFVAILVW